MKLKMGSKRGSGYGSGSGSAVLTAPEESYASEAEAEVRDRSWGSGDRGGGRLLRGLISGGLVGMVMTGPRLEVRVVMMRRSMCLGAAES